MKKLKKLTYHLSEEITYYVAVGNTNAGNYDPWPDGETRAEWDVNITGAGQTYEGEFSWIINGNSEDCPRNHQLRNKTLDAYILQLRSE